MNHTKIYMLFILVLALVLAACGGGEEPVVENEGSEVETTSEEISSEDSNSEETAVSMTDEVRAEEGGFAFQPPAGYDVSIDYIFAELTVAGDSDTQINMIGTPFDDGMNIDMMYEGFTSEFGSDESVTLGERQPITVNGLEGFGVTMAGDDEGTAVQGKLVALGNDTQGVFIFGGAASDKWESEVAAQFDALVNTITLFEATTPAVEETSTTEETAEKAETVAEPTPVEEPEAAAEESTETEVAEESTESEAVEAAAPLPVGSADAGLACFGSTGNGMTCLTTAGEWQPYTSSNSNLGSDFIADMGVCPDGTLLIAHGDGVSAFDGADFREYDSGWGYGSPEGVACTADGNIWVAHFGGASYYDGSAWTTYESAEHLATGEQASDLVNDVVVDGSGNAWVVTSNAIAMYDGSDWTRYQMGEGLNDKYYFDQLAIDGNGRPWALHSNGLLEFDGSDWINHENDDFFSAESFALAPNGDYWLGTYSNGLTSFDGSSWAETNMSNSDLSSDGVRAVAFDNNGRLYIGTVYGLNIMDGDAWTTYNMDSADMVSHNISSMGIVNGGPALPALMDKENGAVTGALEEETGPLAEMSVELCVRELYSSYNGDTPCSDQAMYYTTTTDAEGAFAFEDVPVGVYYIVFQTADGWGKLTDEYGIGSEEIPVASGETTDVGLVTLASE